MISPDTPPSTSMVYKIFGDGNDDRLDRKTAHTTTKQSIKLPKTHTRTQSVLASILVVIIRLVLFIYDFLSYPIYFVVQRPDQRAKRAQRTRSEQVDSNTWIRTNQSPNEVFYGLHDARFSRLSRRQNGQCRSSHNQFMGSTLSEIFANSVRLYNSQSCLGYRAVVTCPVLVLNEEGKHVLQEKSFRSDYTWYTFGQIGRRVQDISSGLYYYSIYPTSRALFLANTCLEWFCASQACFQLSVQLVLVPDIHDKQALYLVVKEAEVDVIFVSCDRLDELCQLLDVMRLATLSEAPHVSPVKRIIIIDWQFSVDFNEKTFEELGKASEGLIELVLSMSQIEEVGIENPIQVNCSRALSDENLSAPVGQNNETHQTSGHSTRRNSKSGASSADESREKTASSHELGERNSIGGAALLVPADHQLPLTAPLRRRTTTTMTKKSPLDGTNSHWFEKHSDTTANQTARQTSPKPHDLAMIVYTYGSLGQIKPIMLTHQHLARSGRHLFLDNLVTGDDVHCTTISLDNIIEFMTEMCVFSHGGSIGYSGNLKTLFYDGSELFKRDKSDLEALGPSFLLVRPYLLERLRTSVHNYLQLQLNPLVSFMMKNIVFEYKKYWAVRHFGTPIVDRLFCCQLSGLFGPNLKYILCNGATDCSETKDFFAFMLNIPVIEIYGPDEASASLISVNDVWDYKRRSKRRRTKRASKQQVVGQFGAAGEADFEEHEDNYKDDDDEADETLEDFPDMQLLPPKVNRNIFREDLSRNLLITSSILCPTIGTRIRLENWEEFRINDQPYPRGRLVIGGDVVCKGYLKRPQVTQETFYTDSNLISWYRTGDIARVFPNGSFEIISAISDIIKMLDGQLISLSQIEHILRNSQFVDNVCAICGEDRRFVISLVVPNLRRLALKSPGDANLKMAIGTEPEPEELADVDFRREVCNDRLLCEFVADHLRGLIVAAGLEAIPNRFLLVPEIWTPETELVTASFEPKRSAIQKYYATDIRSILRLHSRANSQRLSSKLSRKRPFQCPSPSRARPGAGGPSDSRCSINSI